MQKVAAYCLERRDQMNWPEARAAEGRKICAAINEWLVWKKASGDGRSGTYEPPDGSPATFDVQEAADGDRSWKLYRLEERSDDGRHFIANLSVTVGSDHVAVYITLEVGSTVSQISPVEADPKCPRIVRTLLGMPGDWYHGNYTLRRRRSIQGFDNGEGLAAEILNPGRTVPIVVISSSSDGLALPRLDENLDDDLAGLANVFTIDADAAWALTDDFGRLRSCYNGAVRVYWPRFQRADDPYRHPLWTAQHLGTFDDDIGQARERFRRQLRTILMRAAAVSVVRPREIDDIRSAESRRGLQAMKERAKSLEDFEKLAESYAADNDTLLREKSELESHRSELEWQIAQLEDENRTLLWRLSHPAPAGNDIARDSSDADDETDDRTAPSSGEVRYYKKIHGAPKHDIMIPVQDCGCNKWQGAAGADKAKKGIAKLEGSHEWQSVQHCGSCEGGGMWKVKW